MPPAKAEDKVHIWEGDNGEWFWHRKAGGNNEIISDGAEGFSSERNAYDNAERNFGDTVEYVIHFGDDYQA